MQNKISCPHCDKEITTLKMDYNAKQALVIIPIMLLGFTPFFFTIFESKPLASDDLEITCFDTRVDGKEMVVTGMISNLAVSAWKSVSIEAKNLMNRGSLLAKVRTTLARISMPMEKRILKYDSGICLKPWLQAKP